MRKFFFFLAALGGCIQLHALYQSNPSTPEILDQGFFLPCDSFFSVRAGYQRDQVFDRFLKTESHISGVVSDVKQLYDQGVLTINFMDRVDLFGSAGAMDIYVNDRQNVFSVPHQVEFGTHNDFTWGTGIRVDLIDWCSVTMGASASFQYADPEIRWNSCDGAPFPVTGRIRWAEWQIGVALSYNIDIFTPYIGGNYSKVKAKIRRLDNPLVAGYPSSIKMRNRDRFGLALGCDLSSGKYVDIGVEVRMISEQAITLKGDIKF